MPKNKERPPENPTWNGVLSRADSKEKNELHLISREFGIGTFKGRIIANWCSVCGKWRTHYVPVEKAPVDGFTADETFPCTKCGERLPAICNDAHTILRNA